LLNCYDNHFNRINRKDNIADKIAKQAIQRGSGDNITAIVIFL